MQGEPAPTRRWRSGKAGELPRAMEVAQESESRKDVKREMTVDTPKTQLSAAAQRLASAASEASPLHAGVGPRERQ